MEYLTNDFSGNTVNGLELGYFVDIIGLSLNASDYGQIFLINCSSATISNCELSYTSTGVMAAYSHGVTIQDCVFDSAILPVYLYQSPNSIVERCIIVTGEYGLYVRASDSFVAANNSISYIQDYGVYLRTCSDVSLFGNDLVHAGIIFSGASIDQWHIFQEDDIR